MDEFCLIAEVLRPLATHEGAHGLQDDGATLPRAPMGQEWRITTDTLIAGVHFRPDDPIEGVAWRALATNVSDLVAQLATPQFYTLNLSLPHRIDIQALGQGLAQAQGAFGLSLLGGDTTKTPGPLSLCVTAFGLGTIGDNPLRCRAKIGHRIGLLPAPHGPLGAARAGFAGIKAYEAAYLRPIPCLEALEVLQGAQIAALADVSDGLLQDLGHICTASGVGAEVWMDHVPVAVPHVSKQEQITWGDDYALVMSAEVLPDLEGLSEIGRIVSGKTVKLLDGAGREISFTNSGYTHKINL